MTERRRCIAIDVDGVLADLALGLSSLVRDLSVEPVEVCGSGGQAVYPSALVDRAWDRVRESTTFWETLPLLVTEADRLALCRLETVADCIYLTNRFAPTSESARGQTERWVHRHGLPDFPVVLSRDFAGRKLEAVRAYGVTVVLEDSPEELAALGRLNAADDGEEVVYLFRRDWPYNRRELGRAVSSVEEFCWAVLEGSLL